MGIIKEFKEFAMKGNLVDMAIAFVMGGAFGKVVTAFVEKMFAPLVGLLMGGIDLSKKNVLVIIHFLIFLISLAKFKIFSIFTTYYQAYTLLRN
jgi:large conductance mechanosensitive channel protein